MTIELKMILSLDSRAAKAELEAAIRGIKGVSVATSELTGKNKANAAATDTEAAAKKRAAVAARELAEAQRKEAAATKDAAAAARKAAADIEAAARKAAAATAATGRAHAASMGGAAAATGNLAAQFNDIGVMLAAGQNPLQLAIQQGIQISQVFGTAGATGALQLLKAGFLQMLSPVNLVTIGVIALGALGVQALTSLFQAEDEAKDRMDLLREAADQMGAALNDLETTGFTGMEAKAAAVELHVQNIVKLLNEANQIALQTALDKLTSTDGLQQAIADFKTQASLQNQIGGDAPAFNYMGFTSPTQAIFFAQQLKTIEGETRAEIAATVDKVIEATELRGIMTGAAREYLATIAEELGLADQITAKMENSADKAAALEAATQAIKAALAAAASIDLSGVFAGAFGAADTLFGKVKSIIVAAGAANAALKQEYAVANAPGKDVRGLDDERGSQGEARRSAAEFNSTRILAGFKKSTGTASSGGGGGGGASAAKAEADSLQTLIEKLHGEIDALRVQDPIQKEMLKYRKELAGATDAERKQVEALIIAREKEALAVEGMKASKEFFEQTAVNALDALITKGESLQDVLKGVAAAFLKAAIQGALFGQGPFGAAFGGKSILSGVIGKIVGQADGGAVNPSGLIYGRGTGKSDSELRALSVGEFVVNAKATARNRHTLEAINAGSSIPGLAGGGMVDSGRRRGSGGFGRDGGPSMVVNINLAGARGDREIEAAAERGMKKALVEYDRIKLPTSMKRVSGDPRRTG